MDFNTLSYGKLGVIILSNLRTYSFSTTFEINAHTDMEMSKGRILFRKDSKVNMISFYD